MGYQAAKKWRRGFVAVALVSGGIPFLSREAVSDPPQPGIDQRIPWTTSRITGSPEPPPPYTTERAYPELTFKQCLDITTAPGSDRLFVVEQSGKIFSFPNRPDVASADLVVDLAKHNPEVKQVYALAFHPNFLENRYCYVCYIRAADLEDGTHVARFEMKDTDPPTLDPASELTLLTWMSGGHNGCCLKFGPDGCLYVSTGDAGPANPPDPRRTGQDLGDLLSSILRIDVDHPDSGLNYGIPDDNPFVGVEGARGEVWCYGLRNPWRMSFDKRTGDLWVGDVGWELWEMLYRVERGGNYGWAVTEGRATTHPEWTRGPTPILPPTIDHRHTESSSVTEGLTYYGRQLPALQGTHIYGDYDTGKLWGFRYENGAVVDHRELADTTHRIVGFGESPDGELLILDHTAGTIQHLIPAPARSEPDTFPRRLSESGLFASISQMTPAPGVIPYSIRAEPWADYAVSERLVAVPQDLSIRAEGSTWAFPADSVLVKTLSLDLSQGDPATRRRVETQILHFDGHEWMPYSYQWNEDQSDAMLVGAEGSEQTYEVIDADSPGGVRHQVWRFAGRAECQRCHNKWSGPPLAFNSSQLNTDQDYGRGSTSQLATLAHIELIDRLPEESQQQLLTDPYDDSAELTARARSYLHANCAHCHRMHAGGAVLSHMHYDLALDKTNMLGARPTQGTFGIPAAQVIAPGAPFRSALLYRMAKLGAGRMPRIGSTEPDGVGLEVIYQWLQQLPQEAAAPDAAVQTDVQTDDSADAMGVAALQRLTEAKASAEQVEVIDQLLSSTTGALRLLFAVEQQQLPNGVAALLIDAAAHHEDANVRDLFERFLLPQDRIQRLGTVVNAEQILGMVGDPSRGQKVFFGTSGVSCRNCHRIGTEGKQIGPDLTRIGEKQSSAQLLESILVPSKRIDPKFVTWLVETQNGKLLTGLMVSQDEQEVVLRDAEDKLRKIAREDIEQLVPQSQSLMPELLVRDMTAQQLADLLAYLCSLM